MKKLHLLTAVVAAFAVATPIALGAAKGKKPENHDFSFEGPFGEYDDAQLQRGFHVYNQICSSCHGMEHLDYRHLGMEGGPFEYVMINGELTTYDNPNDNEVIRLIAAEKIIMDGPDEFGEMFERPGRPTDGFVSPYANEAQGRAFNGGAYPPDLSVITKARYGGAEYIRSLLLGYDQEPPEYVDIRPGQYYNPYMSGSIIAMPPQLFEGMVEYADGTEATAEQMATDVAAFLAWAGEPHLEARKRMGWMVMLYLLALSILLYVSYRQIWSKVEH